MTLGAQTLLLSCTVSIKKNSRGYVSPMSKCGHVKLRLTYLCAGKKYLNKLCFRAITANFRKHKNITKQEKKIGWQVDRCS